MASFASILTALGLALLLSLQQHRHPACAQCSSSANKGFAKCVDLQPGTLAYTYMPETHSASIAYSDAPLTPAGWVGWGVNFNATTMVGAHVLLAFKHPATGAPIVLPYKLTPDVYSNPFVPLLPATSNFDLSARNVSAVISASSFSILAVISLPSHSSAPIINTIYNRGPSVSDAFEPAPHGVGQRNGMKRIDLSTGTTSSAQGPHQALKALHGILATSSWGVATILGAMTARYVKQHPLADSTWFYVHVFFQSCAYLLGFVAWSLGLRLGALSPGVMFPSHRNLGIAIFSIATVQMGALFARPNTQHKLRPYWNLYHHTIGYTIIILSVINIFKGFTILSPPGTFKNAYIAFIVVIACISLILEALMWANFIQKRIDQKGYTHNHGSNQHARNGTINGTQLGDRPK